MTTDAFGETTMAPTTALEEAAAAIGVRWDVYWLAGQIGNAMLAGVEPTMEWAKARHWIGEYQGLRVERAPGSFTDAEIGMAMERAEFLVFGKPPELLSVDDVAAALGLSPARIRFLAGELGLGRIIGNARILTPADLAQLAGRTHGKPGPGGRPRKEPR